jgi:glycosyltransferase involved in cell wall biosynthesis
MAQNVSPQISMIIPAFNEELTIAGTVKSVCSYGDAKRISYEVIVVNDGSTDSTRDVIRGLSNKYPMLRLLDNGANMGKGYSVYHGMQHAQGGLALFMDADNSTKITELDKVLLKYQEGYGVIIGSRQVPGARIAVHQSRWREYSGRFVNKLIIWVTGLKFTDTQAGFKAFSRPAREIIFSKQRVWRWLFDVELLMIARANNIPVAEIPITWENSRYSRVKLLHFFGIIKELIFIKFNSWRGLYQGRA